MNDLLLWLPKLLVGEVPEEFDSDDVITQSMHFWNDDAWADSDLDDNEFATLDELRVAQQTFEQTTPGSSASFQAAQAATMPTEETTRWFKMENGNISTDVMVPIEKGTHHLRPDAARAYKAMQKAMKKDLGYGFSITDSYRDLATQKRLYLEKPGFAASPGTSNHGWGMALDINVNDPKVLDWLRNNGKRFGYHELRHSDGSVFEPWHWDFKPDTASRLNVDRYKIKEPKDKPQRKRFRLTDPLEIDAPELNDLSTITNVMGSVYGERRFIADQPGNKTARNTGRVPDFVPDEYKGLFLRASRRYGVPVKLLALVAQKESGFNPEAKSSAGALGMMQVMPQYHKLNDYFDPNESVMYGAKYISDLLGKYKGDWRNALAHYNAGYNLDAGYGYADSLLEAWRG